MRLKPLAMAMALAASPAFAADDLAALKAELQRLTERIAALEVHNKEMEKALATDRISEKEPEVVTRLKAVEFQALSMQKQSRQIEALEGITVGASLTGVAQKVNAAGTASGEGESRLSYRGDVSITLPGGTMGDIDGKIFTHMRFGQGNGVGLRPTYTSTPNTTAFQASGVTDPDSSFAILAQAWYQLTIPLPRDGLKMHSKEHMHLTVGKIDPFVFFDQNAAADDETTKFLNNAFVHNPLLDSGRGTGADRYGFAPGAIVQYVNEREKGAEWLLSLGVFGTSGTSALDAANFNGSPGAPLVIAQAQTAARFNYLPGNYRIYAWHNGRGTGSGAVNGTYDGVERRHSGWGVSADQKIDDNVTLFARYGHQLKGKVRFDRALVGGIEFGGAPWGRAADAVGLALGGLRTSRDFHNESLALDADNDGVPDYGYQAQGWEKLAEVYYRFRFNNRLELSPDFQYIQRPAGDGSASAIKVVGLRARIGF